MAVVTTKSGQITNRDASPSVANNPGLHGGYLKTSGGFITAASGDSSTSTYIMAQVPSNAYVKDVLLSCEGAATAGAADIGIYQTTANGGAVVDADFFASVVLLTTELNRSSVVHESEVYDKEDVEKPLWEALGLSEDSNRMYDVVITLTTGIDAADDIGLEVQYQL